MISKISVYNRLCIELLLNIQNYEECFDSSNNLLLIPFSQYIHAGSPGIINEDLGAFTFHTESDDNANISYAPSYGDFSNLTQEDV
ncbi:hypothetical protein BH23THE1_BH23THE1_20870 [soil metagenome]